MTIDEARTAKTALDTSIASMIFEFHKGTGLTVLCVNVRRFESVDCVVHYAVNCDVRLDPTNSLCEG